jgi:hypothetical protein
MGAFVVGPRGQPRVVSMIPATERGFDDSEAQLLHRQVVLAK